MQKLIVFIIFIGLSYQVIAQTNDAKEFQNLLLPPFETLIENLKGSSQYKYYDSKIITEEELLKKEKLSWLSFFSIIGTYQYGMMGLNSYTNVGANFPLIYQVSGTEQLWYNVGGVLSFPLNKVFERKRSLRAQKSKIITTIHERDMWYDDQKIKVITSYLEAQKVMSQMEIYEEAYEYAKAQFQMMEKDFILGKITAGEISVSKTLEMQAHINLQNAKSELKSAILKLEVLTNTKILNK